jgi:PAS domain S-box-containing protein
MDQVVDHGFRDPNQFEQIISCLREGVMVLDEYGDLVWVNDAALRSHGAESEDELGETWKDYAERFELRYRNNHRLAEEAYPMARAIAGENLRDVVVEVRQTGREDPVWIHSVSSLRLGGSSSGPQRIVLFIADLTEQYQAERRFESAFNANPAPAVICRLSDLHYVRANAGFLEMTGYAREEVVGRSAYELDVLADADKRELALERLKQGRTIPQMESCIPLSDGTKKFVIVAGEPIQIGSEACMLFTFTDLDPLKKTELALRHSEERFSKSFHLSPVPQTIALLKGFKITEVNRAFREKTGYTDEEVIGRSARELVLWADEGARQQIEDAIARTGSIDGIDMRMRTKDGATIDCLTSAVTVTINDETCVLWVIQDIGDRKRSEDELMTAIETVMEDTSWFSRTVVEKLAGLRRATSPLLPSAELDELTDRERDILDLICQGQSDEAMSKTLGLSRNTIRNHISSLYRKIGVNRRSAAIIWARERGVTGREVAPRRKAQAGPGPKTQRK